MRLRRFIGLAAMCVLGGCSLFSAGDDNDRFLNVTAQQGADFRLQEDGTALLLPDSLRLRLDAASDSRCPKGATCVTAGFARAELTLSAPQRAPASFSLRGYIPEDGLDEGPPADGLVQDTLGYRVSLVRLDPFPDIRRENDRPKVATLRVESLTE